MNKKLSVFLFLIGLFFASLFVGGETESASVEKDVFSAPLGSNGLDVYFFYGQGCPHCARVEPFLAEMELKYPLQLHKFDVYSNRSCLSLFDQYSDMYGLRLERRGVPTVFVSDTYLVGDTPILDGFEEVVKKALKGSSPVDKALEADTPESLDAETISVGGGLSIVAITVAALVDAISPCSIAILVFLIGARVLVANPRKRALKVGLAFCLSVFIAYFLFGLGLFTVVQVSGFSSIFSLLVGLVAVLAGIFYLKDVFWYGGGGFVMEVPRSLKPLLMRMLKGVASPFGAFVMGFVVVCFELPCTGGPYLFILGQVANGVARLEAVSLLLYYNFIFVLPLIVISLLLYSNLFSISKVREWNEKNRRLLRLVGGFAMMALGSLVIPVPRILQLIWMFLSYFKVFGPPVLVVMFLYFVVCFAKRRNLVSALIRLPHSRFVKFAVAICVLTVPTLSGGFVMRSMGQAPGTCGGPAGPCSCGDVVVNTHTLSPADPVTVGPCLGNGLIIGARGITLDCNGFTITGDGNPTTNDYGIYNGWMFGKGGHDNVTIRNCRVTQFSRGILLDEQPWNPPILNNTLIGNNLYLNSYSFGISSGISMYTVYNSNIINNTATHNVGGSVYGIGIDMSYCVNNTVFNNTVTSNNVGIWLELSHNNTIRENNPSLNNLDGIYAWYNCTNNLIDNNTVRHNGDRGIVLTYRDLTGWVMTGDTNTTLTNNQVILNTQGGIILENATNTVIFNNTILSNGPTKHGINSTYSTSTINWNTVCFNRIQDFNSSNWMTSSGDNNTCDNPDGWNDTGTVGCTFNCSTVTPPPNCTIPRDDLFINSNTVLCPGVYNIWDVNWDGVIIMNASNIVLECNGSTLNGIGKSPGRAGIYVNNKNNVTIRNCNVMRYNYGIELGNTNSSILINNTAKFIGSAGIFLDNSNNNILINNTANSNSWGIYLMGDLFVPSGNNMLINNTANSNIYGAVVSYSAYNNLTGNDFTNNSDRSLHLDGAKIHCNNSIDTSNIGGYDGKSIRYEHDTTGITIQNTDVYSEIFFCNVNDSVIDNVTVYNSYLKSGDIRLWYSNNNSIRNCNASNNHYGFSLKYAHDNTLINNTADSNYWNGISVEDSKNNTLINNTADSNNYAGILLWGYLQSCINNTISNNTANSNYYGIYLYSSQNNTVINNSLNNNTVGFYVNPSSDNLVERNRILNNGIGIFSEQSNSTINHNTVCFNTQYDFYSSNWLSSSGDNNTCDNPDGWNDTGTLGCSCSCPVGVNTSTGTGVAYFSTNYGTIVNLTAVNESSLPTAGKPTNITFPHGFFSFNITGLTPGQTVMVTITYPASVSNTSQYWKYGPTPSNTTAHWYQIPVGSNDGDPTITINLTDGGLGDHDLTANGIITDPSGIGVVGRRDVAIIDIILSKTIVGQGFTTRVNITAQNQGDYEETFNVTLYANTTPIATLTNIALPSGNSTTLTIPWNTTGIPKGNYTIKAYITSVPGETDTKDNTLTDGIVTVTIPGDIDGDNKVGYKDLFALAAAYGSKPGDSNWNPNCDIDGDNKVGYKDLFILAANYGKKYP